MRRTCFDEAGSVSKLGRPTSRVLGGEVSTDCRTSNGSAEYRRRRGRLIGYLTALGKGNLRAVEQLPLEWLLTVSRPGRSLSLEGFCNCKLGQD